MLLVKYIYFHKNFTLTIPKPILKDNLDFLSFIPLYKLWKNKMTHLALIEIAQVVNFIIQAEREMTQAVEPCAAVFFDEK